jgi:quercetin dioxygenase-like cupin family protein
VRLVPFEPTREITHFDSRGATIAGIARAIGETRVLLLELAPGGVLGLHPASCPQLFLVVSGAGRVRSGDEQPQPIERGTAAVWDAGEPHETTTEDGLTAVVVEADSLELL